MYVGKHVYPLRYPQIDIWWVKILYCVKVTVKVIVSIRRDWEAAASLLKKHNSYPILITCVKQFCHRVRAKLGLSHFSCEQTCELVIFFFCSIRVRVRVSPSARTIQGISTSSLNPLTNPSAQLIDWQEYTVCAWPGACRIKIKELWRLNV